MLRGCPSCRLEQDSRLLFVANDSVTGEPFEVVQCSGCGLSRTDPRPEAAELDRFYPTGYHNKVKRYLFGLDRTLSIIHRSRIRQIEQLVGGSGSVVDIGCGPGWFLNSMREQGWAVRGTERSVSAATQACEVLNLDVGAVELDELVAEGKTYDAVVLWHVAEHLQDPRAAICDIAGLLRPGGVAMIGVPNFGSFEAKIAKAGWFHLDVPRHLYHFTPVTLRALVEGAGLNIRRTTYGSPEYDIFSFIQSTQNRCGLPFNLLYDVLRRREARLGNSAVTPLFSALAVVSAVPLALVGLLWTQCAAALRMGATMTFYVQAPSEVTSVKE
ncbi:MAG TPA: class I SAM-dependent methyltransferase [Acidimicrobiales bacterium]|nr:class I SAM-dependent methyltransferase [Acidimicrobiales bacterium]